MIRNYTEVYDMNTKLNEMTIIAIHTPQAQALKRMFKGHFINFKKYRILGCDIKMACASTLPLSPDQVGLEAGEVDPRDVMNPMLFKACTGDNLNALLNQIYNKSAETAEVELGAEGSIGEHIVTNKPSRDAYYQMLSDPTWRKAHPQAGLTVRNLKPYVHKVATTQPFKYTGLPASTAVAGSKDLPRIAASSGGTSGAGSAVGFGGPNGKELDDDEFDATNSTVFVTNGITPMPWLDTAVPQTMPKLEDEGTSNRQVNYIINNVPRCYMGCLLMPPGVSTKFYMRMVISWRIAFKDWRPAYEIGNIDSFQMVDRMDGMAGDSANSTYFNYYHDSSSAKKMEEVDTFKEESSFASNGLDSSEMVYAS